MSICVSRNNKLLVEFMLYKALTSLSFLCDSEENLRAALGKMGVGGRAMEDVMDKVRNRHYQVMEITTTNLRYTFRMAFRLLLIFTKCLTCGAVGMHLNV